MNTSSSTAQRTLHGHPPSTAAAPTRALLKPVSLLDRLALHLGVALVRWSRRSRVAVRHERRASRVEQLLATDRRERGYERALRTLTPPR